MHTTSRIARLQQMAVLWLLAWAAGLAWWGVTAPTGMAGWALVPLLLHPGVLLMQCAMAHGLNHTRGLMPFKWGGMARAWWSEVRASTVVFGLWQPWGWRAWPDLLPAPASTSPPSTPPAAGHRGVLLVHGFMCNRGFWTPWLAELHRRQHPFVAVNLEPIMGSIDAYGPALDTAVRQLTLATGEPPLVVAHSMGGLAVRAWLRHTPGALDRVAHIVTIGTPHQGTWLARFGLGANAAQMRQGSAWLAALAQGEGPAVAAKFTCWHSDGDNIVFPLGTAVLPGAQAHHLPGTGHVALAAMAPVVMAQVLGALRDGMPHSHTLSQV